MTTNEASDDAQLWLAAAAAPGRVLLRLTAGVLVLETVFTAAQWAGLAAAAQALFARPAVFPGPALAVMFGGGILAAAATWGAARLRAGAGRRISHSIRQRLIARLLPAGPRGSDPDAATAALATVELTGEVADHHAEMLPHRLCAPVSMAVVFVATAAVLWPAAVLLLVASLLVPLNLRLAGMFAREGADARVAATARLAAVVLDSFRGLRTLQSIGAVPRRRVQLADAAARLNAATMTQLRRAFISGTVMEVLITFSIAADATYVGLSLLGYLRLPGTPDVTLFAGLLALLLCPMYFAPLRTMAAAHHSRERAAAAAPVIMALLTEKPASCDVPVARPRVGPVAVRLEQVGLSPVIEAVSLTVAPGEWTAITGPSGAGKTTLLSLIAGARRPSTGTVEWITTSGPSAPELGGCAWIGQRTVILPGSVADNIRLGRPSADPADVERAVLAAGLADVVARLPDGLDTELGEGGWGVSTGEARRIAVARAFLRDAELWLLDEPTAHLDPDAEARLIDALRVATRGRTVIVATHSAALARGAQTVLAVADGSVQLIRRPVAA